MSSKTAAIILAAGKGKRMKSDLPKVLHCINEKPLVRILMETMTDELADFNVDFVWQKELLGTGHAVMQARALFEDFDGTILVAAGDVPFLSSRTIEKPFLSSRTIEKLFDVHHRNQASATCLSAIFDDPSGYGRIVRQGDSDILLDIVEDKDAPPEIKKIKEINSGTFCFNSLDLFNALGKVGNENAQQEYYLTDTIKILQRSGKKCAVTRASDSIEAAGINSVEQLESLAKEITRKK